MTAASVIKTLKNKYVLTLICFSVLMLFIDHNDIFVQMDRSHQLKELQASKKYYEQQIEQTKKNLSDLQNDPASLEKYAREKYLMKKENEDLFVIPEEKLAEKTQ